MTLTCATRTRFMLLAPFSVHVPQQFRRLEVSRARHEGLLAKMQTLRGWVYLADGAITTREISPDGRHRLAVDDRSWHLLSLDEQDRVCGCVRYLPHHNNSTFDNLWVRGAALASCDQWGGKLRAAVESELEQARRRSLSYVEVGGWALAPERRCTGDALRLALATYGMARLLGGCLGITTATTRHCSSSILRKIGGRSLDYGGPLPSYYDPQYQCQMEILRFDSGAPNFRYAGWIEQLQAVLTTAPVVCRARRERPAPKPAPERIAPMVPAWVPVAQAV